MSGHWSGAQKAPAVTRKRCPRGCGQRIDEYREPYGRVVALDVTPPAVTVDLATVAARLYEYHGPRVGWSPKLLPIRGWRELRLLHECAGGVVPTLRATPTTKRRSTRR